MIVRTAALILVLSISCSAQEGSREPTQKIAHASIRLDPKNEDSPIVLQQGTSAEHTRPYIHPLRSPDGKHVLTQFSPGHHKHQTGLYWGQTRINGRDYFHHYKNDYWKRVENQEGQHSMVFRSQLLDAKGEPMLQERQTWTYRPASGHYVLDLAWTGSALTEVTIGKYAYGGLFLRMPWKGGTKAACLNSEGHKNQQGEGKAAKWVDLAMQIEGMEQMAHIALIDHPKNPGYPNLWRIDGQFGVGPALARRGDIKIPKGDSLTFRYRLVVYENDEFKEELLKQETASFGAE